MLILDAAATVQQASIEPFNGLSLAVSPSIASRYRNGVEVIHLLVSPDCVISTCAVSIEERGPVTDKEICSKLMTLKATSATDQDGHKAYGMVEFRIAWNVVRPDETPRLPAAPRRAEPDFYLPLGRIPDGVLSDAVSSLIIVAGTDGKVETCEIQHTSGVAALDIAACRAMALAGITPLRNATGAAVRAVRSIRVGFSVKP